MKMVVVMMMMVVLMMMVKYCTFQQVMKILKTINPAVQDDVDNDLVMSRGSSNPDFAAWMPLEFSLGAPSY